jgi:hypothetical protein
MKLSKNVFLPVLILAAAMTQAMAEPLARLSVRSYGDLTNAVARLAAQIDPKSEDNPAQEFAQGLGLVNPADFDAKRPWEVAIWYEGGAVPPLTAIKAPASNANKFKDSLGEAGFLKSQAREYSQLDNGWTLIVFKETASLSESEKSALDQWKKEAVRPPARLLELSLTLTETLRMQAKSMLAIGKMAISQSITSAQAPATPGLNPAATAEVLNAYFELIDTYLTGFNDLKLGLDMDAEALTLDNRVTAKPDTDLAKWLQKPAGQIAVQDLNALDPNAFMSLAAYMGKEPSLVKLLQKFTVLGFKMQNVETNDPVIKEVETLLDKMLPMTFTGSVYMKDKFTMMGVYRFPKADVGDVYGQLKQFVKKGMQTQVGKDKLYSAATIEEKHHTLNGLSVDRFTMAMNLDNPVFSAPGAKEQIQTWWPNGKIEIDYAIKDGQMLMASPDRMKDLLESLNAKANPKTTLKLEPATCLAGTLNIINMMKQIMAANPMVPQTAKDKMAQLDATGVGLEFQMSVDNQMHTSLRAPLKLFRELGRLKDN